MAGRLVGEQVPYGISDPCETFHALHVHKQVGDPILNVLTAPVTRPLPWASLDTDFCIFCLFLKERAHYELAGLELAV